MLLAIKQFELNGVQVLAGQQVNPRLPPALIRKLISTHRLKRVEEAVPTAVFARRAFVYDGETVKPGDRIAGLNDKKRRILLDGRFVEERETDTPTPPVTRKRPRKRARKE
jgi:hypothetical protein